MREAISLIRGISIILCAGIFAFLAGYFWIPSDWSVEIIRYGTKPFIYLIHAAIFFSLLKVIDWKRSRTVLSAHWLLLGVAITGSLFLLAREPYGFKVLSDEYVISSQAKSLHFTNTSDFPGGALTVYGNTIPRHSVVDKRPPAFSALLATVHDLSGYRIGNVFFVNSIIASSILLILLYLGRPGVPLARDQLPHFAWILCLALSLPLFAQNANGAGLELYNILLILCSGWLAYRFLQDDGLKWLPLFVFVSLLLFYARYESALFALSVGGVILVKSWRLGKIPGFWFIFSLPFLLIPYLLRHRVFALYPDSYWQLADHQSSAFSFHYFYENIGFAVMYFYQLSIEGSGSYLLAYLGTLAGVVLAVRILKKTLTRQTFSSDDVVLFLYGSVVVFNFLLLMCYHWGQLESIEVSRLALPIFLLFGFAIHRVSLPIFAKKPQILYVALAVGIGYLLFVSIPSSGTAISTQRNYHARIDAWAVQLLKAQRDPNPLVISPVPLVWDLYETAFYSPNALHPRRRNFEYHWLSQSFSPYILEKIKVDPSTGQIRVVEAVDFAEPYELEILGEYPYKPYHYARFSRITGFKNPDARKQIFDEETMEGYREIPIEYWFLRIP